MTFLSDIWFDLGLFLTTTLQPKSAIPMNSPHNVEKDALVATACVQAMLKLIPCMTGLKEACMIWMQDNLEGEVVSNTSFTLCPGS